MRRFVDGLGRGLMVAGALVLLFVAFQLWGTGLVTAREQSRLRDDFAEARTAARDAARDADARPVRPVPGGAVGIIEIPEIGVDDALVEGVGVADLRKGPGHYPTTVLPGEDGNTAIAGHRTTYGAPFNRLDDLEPGDRVEVTTVRGRFVYRVRETLVVEPSTVHVLRPTHDARLTLTTCHPEYSARQRLVVVASLDTRAGDAALAPSRPPGDDADLGDLDAGAESGWAAADLGTGAAAGALALASLGWWWLWRARRHWAVAVGGAVPVLIVLFFFFVEVEQLLPANF